MAINFVLGAPDPEMETIERLVLDGGHMVAYATVGGSRVHPGVAYRANGANGIAPPVDGGTVVAVECGGPAIDGIDGLIRVDHHRPGDPGYGREPGEFLPASSLGQVLALLARSGSLPDSAVRGPRVAPAPGERSEPGEIRPYESKRRGRRARTWEIAVRGTGGLVWWREVSSDLVYTAAADHCLAAAYAGQCHGVLPGRLMERRARERARYQGRSVASLMRDLRAARSALAAAPRIEIGGVEVADMRPGRGAPCGEHGAQCDGLGSGCWGDVPELPEAAARDGVPFVAIPRPRPGDRRKVVLQAAPPAAIEAVLGGALGLDETYGDPARGFAGGYLP